MSGRVLYLDCVGGVAGDMLLSALVEALGDAAAVDRVPAALGLRGVELSWSTVRSGGFAARHLEVHWPHAHHHQHRHLADIAAIIAGGDLPERAKGIAQRAFRRLAEAEARVHGCDLEQVHFHEVGAVDAIVDVVGAAVAVDLLDVATVVCSSLPMGHGTVRCDHGVLPLPAPAVAAMLPGVPVHPVDVAGETVTPTGAALVTTLADRFGVMPAMTVEAVGLGCGSRHYPGLPNLVRAFVGHDTAVAAADADPSAAVAEVVECNLDDLDPRVLPVVVDELMRAGALDAYVTPIVMKKGRPGHLITAVSPPTTTAAVVATLLHHTTSLGCRVSSVRKHHLERRMESVDTPWGPVPVKVALAGGRVLRRIPELEPCAELARRLGVPLRDILAAAGGGTSEDPCP